MWYKPYNWEELSQAELAEQILEAQYQQEKLNISLNLARNKVSQLENELKKAQQDHDGLRYSSEEVARELKELLAHYRQKKAK